LTLPPVPLGIALHYPMRSNVGEHHGTIVNGDVADTD
jgi:hypothetical protein